MLGGLLTWPVGWDGYASILGWLTGRGASVKIAGAVSAAVLGTGVGIQQGLVLRGDPGQARASAAAPASVQPQSAQSGPRPPASPPTRPAPEPKQAPAKQQASSQAQGDGAARGGQAAGGDDHHGRDRPDDRPRSARSRASSAELQAAPERATRYIRKIPKVVSGIGALSAAEIPSAITLRVSTGSTIPSSQRRAVE